MNTEKKLTGYPSIDKPWLKYYPEGAENSRIPEQSMFQMLEDANKNNLNNVAIQYYGFKITYKKYINRIYEIARALNELSIKKDEIVLLILPNIPECRMLIYGVNILGAIAYPISPILSENVLQDIIEKNNVKHVFCFDAFFQNKFNKTITESKSIEKVVILDGKESIPKLVKLFDKKKTNDIADNRVISWDEFIKSGAKNTTVIKPHFEKNHTAIIIGTSGTTGTPKGVCLTNENLNAMAVQHKYGDMNIAVGDTLLDILIQSIGYGLFIGCFQLTKIEYDKFLI